jgi:hypothetical protein
MRGTKRRWILAIVVGILVAGAAGFVAVGLVLEDSWPARLLAGAGVWTEEPLVFPSEDVSSSPLPRAQSSQTGRALAGGLSGAQVSFEGLWSGYCKIWGLDPDHHAGAKYYAGALEMLVEGSRVPGYCIELDRQIQVGDAYQANVYVSTDPELCAVNWILSHYHFDHPAQGLSSAEEGAAIQAAVWHFVGGFQPQWDRAYWCGKQAVFRRAWAIIFAARGKCVALPDSLDLSASSQRMATGQFASLAAHLQDQLGRPLAGQAVEFSTTSGALSMAQGVTNDGGWVIDTLTYAGGEKPTVTARASGQLDFAIVEPIDAPKQLVIVLRPVPYTLESSVEIAGTEAAAGTSVKTFVAQRSLTSAGGKGVGVTLRWETSSEEGNQGFNLYRGPSRDGPWTKLNAGLIPSLVEQGGQPGAVYEWLDSSPAGGAIFYLLEAVASDGATSQHGPVTP